MSSASPPPLPPSITFRESLDCRLQLSFAVFLPFIAAWVGGPLHWPTETEAIENTILIQAPAERMWSMKIMDPIQGSILEVIRKRAEET